VHQSEARIIFLNKFLNQTGDFLLLLLVAYTIGGRLAKDNRLTITSFTAAKEFVVSSVFTSTVKQLTHYHQPYQDDIPDNANLDGPLSDFG
jgi:hypothetical protein